MASSSISFLLYHIIFSVKQRQYWIMEDYESRVHSYIAGMIKNIGGKPIIVGGQRDHIHILSLLPRHLALSEVMKLIKGKTAFWYNHELAGVRPKMIWQEADYAAMALGAISSIQNEVLVQSFQSDMITYIKNAQAEAGITSWGNANASSTAQAIIGLLAVGENPRGENYTINEVDLVEALMTFMGENGFRKQGRDGGRGGAPDPGLD
ncbi:MAG: transposase, partial [Candidatus Cloacimonadota bacterium]